MATAWEYTRVEATAEIASHEGGSHGKARDLTEEAWIAKLNELGKEGWELVSERFTNGGDSSTQYPYWGLFIGTMRRPVSGA